MISYINPRGKVLAHLDRLAAWQAGQKPMPVSVEWDLSNRCVLGCQSCHFAHTHTRGPWATRKRALPMAHEPAGDLADTALVMRSLTEMQRVGVRGVMWAGGGEPTTHPEWLDVIKYAHGVGLHQGMYTLGGLLTKDSGRELAKRADWVVVSLDAVDAETYAREKAVAPNRFQAACEGVRHLIGHKAVVGISFLLHGENWMYAPEMSVLAQSLGASYVLFRPTIETSPASPGVCETDRSWVSTALPLLQELATNAFVHLEVDRFTAYRDWTNHSYSRCYGPRLTATVTPDGRVWVCPNRREMSGSCLGDLREESFTEIWARHPGHWDVDEKCRVMCRLNSVNESLAEVYRERAHAAFI